MIGWMLGVGLMIAFLLLIVSKARSNRSGGDYDDYGDDKDWTDYPPTWKQLKYLRDLGYDGPRPETSREAHNIIEDMENSRY
jgi:hypothetical protein